MLYAKWVFFYRLLIKICSYGIKFETEGRYLEALCGSGLNIYLRTAGGALGI